MARTFQITKSAALPGASVPRSTVKPRARAALRVTPASASSEVRPNNRVPMLMVSSSEVAGAEPGLQSVASAMWVPADAEGLDGRLALIRQTIERDRQQHGDRSRSGEGGSIGFRGVLEVIARQRVMAGGHLRAAEIGELLRVHLDRQPQVVRGVEQALRLRDIEGDVFAEDIHRIDQPLRVEGGQPVGDDRVDVLVGAARKLRRHRVGGEECGLHRDGISLAPVRVPRAASSPRLRA